MGKRIKMEVAEKESLIQECLAGQMRMREAAYCALEAELQNYLNTYTSTHDYDEYYFDLDAIEHDPYVLISMLCVLHEGEWTLAEVEGTIQTICDRQYILPENVVTERRYYVETDTWTDDEGNTHSSSYRVYYDYYICTTTLKNEDMSHLPVFMMGGEQLSRYSLYISSGSTYNRGRRFCLPATWVVLLLRQTGKDVGNPFAADRQVVAAVPEHIAIAGVIVR